MQSFIIASRNTEKRKDYIESFCTSKSISQFDKHYIQPGENSFGITEIRNVQKTAFLRPQKGSEKAIILENAQKLTTEAQNALLKMLEEPPTNTYIFLSATTENFFLPTILSRCKLIILPEQDTTISDEEKEILHSQIQIMTTGTVGDKLYLAEKVAGEKEKIGEWLREIVLLLRDNMLEDPKNATYPNFIVQMQEASKFFQTTNVAPRVLLEHTFLSL